MERRRAYLRLSLVLNVILLIAPLVALYRGYTLDRPADHFALVHAWHNPAAAAVGEQVHALQDFERLPEVDEEYIKTPTPTPAPSQQDTRDCSICHAGPIGARLCDEWGADAMTRAMSYTGTNNRLRRVLAKMRAGKPFTVASVGGSVSAGHGLHTPGGELYSKDNMHVRFFKYLDEQFPAAQGSVMEKIPEDGKQNAFINGAKPAAGSDYYCMCAGLHVPEEVDLIVVELAINDSPHPATSKSFELLLRLLLEMDSQPAVLLFNTFALMFDQIARGGEYNHGIAQYYDVPVISTINTVLPRMFANESEIPAHFAGVPPTNPKHGTLEGADLRHFGHKLHAFSGDLMSAYIETQQCEMDRIEERAGGVNIDELYPVTPLNPQRLLEKFRAGKVEPKIKPFCSSVGAEQGPLEWKSQNGWRHWAWKEKKYIIADKPGSKITFEYDVSHGFLQLYYLRSKTFGLGNARCWIDDDMGSAKIIRGYWDDPTNVGRTETWVGPPGKHEFHCEVLEETDDPKGGREIRLMSLMGY